MKRIIGEKEESLSTRKFVFNYEIGKNYFDFTKPELWGPRVQPAIMIEIEKKLTKESL